MNFCPHCGNSLAHDPKVITVPSKLLADKIQERLVDYGYPVNMRPEKYQAYIGVRKTLSLLVPEITASRELPADSFKLAVEELDRILPPTSMQTA